MIEVGIDEATIIVRLSFDIMELKSWERYALAIVEKVEKVLCLPEVFGSRRKAEKNITHYNESYSYGNHTFYFGVGYSSMNPALGVIIKFSAQSLREYKIRYYELTGVTVDVNTMLVILNDEATIAYCSRIDPYVDFIDEHVDISALHNGLVNGDLYVEHGNGRKNTSRISGFSEQGECKTFYIGRYRQKNTRIFLRVYDKKAEQQQNRHATRIDTAQSCKDWVRFEVVFKEQYARELTDKLRTVSDDMLVPMLLSAILDRYRFTDGEEYLECTKKMIELSEGQEMSFPVRREADPELVQRFGGIVHHSGLFPFLYIVKRIWGQEGLDAATCNLWKEFNDYCSHPPDAPRRWAEKHIAELADRTPPFGWEDTDKD